MKIRDTKWVKYASGAIGGCLAGIAIMFGGQYVVYPAISSLIGLAVAESASVWNSVRDGSVGDNVSNGVSYMTLGMWDGTNFDRARGDTTNGLDVDVTRLPGSITPSDAFANPTNALNTFSLGGIFNGSTWDRWRGQVSPVQVGTLLNTLTAGAADTAHTVTLTGVASTKVHIYKLRGTCSPAGASTISVTDGGTTIYNSPVPATPLSMIETWTTGLTISTGSNSVITLNTCGSGNVGVITIEADQF